MTLDGGTPGKRLLRLATLTGLLALLATSACRDPASLSGTALFVTAEFEPTLELTQFRVSGDVEGGDAIPVSLLPEQPERSLQSGETFRVLLAGAPDGAEATLRVEGLRADTVVAWGESTARVRGDYEVDVTVRLSSTPPSGGGPDGGTADGGMSDGGTSDGGTSDGGSTFCVDCASGCCQDGICTTPTFATCGIGGLSCTACTPGMADRCSAQGFCACGASPACSGPAADRCVGGQCKCGGGNACGPGQVCDQGRCRCTAESCDGCCAGDTCRPGTDKNECGRGGMTCDKCRNQCLPDGGCT